MKLLIISNYPELAHTTYMQLVAKGHKVGYASPLQARRKLRHVDGLVVTGSVDEMLAPVIQLAIKLGITVYYEVLAIPLGSNS